MQSEITRLSNKYNLFFAFNEKQLKEGLEKHNIKENEPLTRIVSGGIMPRKNAKKFLAEFNQINNKMIKKIKKLKPEPIIRYELANYESWYTGDISNAFEVLKEYGYTIEQVKEVYFKYRED
jgi:hypothetical protein